MNNYGGFCRDLIIEKHTKRLYIRSYNDIDYQKSLLLYSDPDLTCFFDHGESRTKKEINNYLQERQSYGFPFGVFSVFLKDSLDFIGQIDAVPTGIPGEVEIGWIFLKEFQNLGYCSEAIIFFLIPLIKDMAKEKIEASAKIIERIIATAHPENKASQRIMAKAGLSFYKKGLRYGGKPRNWYELNIGHQYEE